jgi:hypothetical protein
MAMCGEEMQGFDECGKIDAARFFVISAMLLSLASALALIGAFLPYSATRADLRRKLLMCGANLAVVVLLWNFIGVCIAGSVKMEEGYNLNGAGFVFLVLEMFTVILARVLAVGTSPVTSPCWSSSPAIAETSQRGQMQEKKITQDGKPNLLTMVGQPQKKEEGKAAAGPTADLQQDAQPEKRVVAGTSGGDGIISSEQGRQTLNHTDIEMGQQPQAEQPAMPVASQEAVIEMNSPRNSSAVCTCPGMK